ncbi:TetR family transcriptional regulator C-terminal domain-containing protein [Paracoccus endophyticus]|uniref:TetR family transcriptional regulator C-terminal domain-containing protein n=1 Tax=Paracoccus endophyticus TaxID=2233774 RepID=UPI000DD5AB0E|nr:TetR family transcriptional regulator C-terminal domain-containing protein [Paracoccus endophyticus]
MPDLDAQRTRIQTRNRQAILDAALEAFSSNGYAGVTIDRIAEGAGLSKPNVLYYFPSKEAIHHALLDGLLDLWLAPLRDMDPDGQPLDEILAYVARKLDLSRRYPRESRLFAHEILQGAPHLAPVLGGQLAALVADRAALVAGWMAQGRLAAADPHHLIMSIWALTQHYADFDLQVRAVLGPGHDPFAEAGAFLDRMYRRLLTP